MKQLSLLYVDFDNEDREYYLSLFNTYMENVSVVKNGEEAYLFYKEFKPDVIVLEPLVPEGLTLAKKIRENDYETILCALTNDTTVLMLQDIVELFFIAYLHKPVSTKELTSTLIKIKRSLQKEEKIKLSSNAFWDKKSEILYINNKYIELTKRETKFLELLVKKRDIFCSDEDIFYHIWGDEFDKIIERSSIRTLVKNLRKKLPKGFIENRYGIGYKIKS
ncbi:MAG: response regulator transcription factor [Sulfurovaceae bacterium]|nr:response regulator transcription factor [Sulfurovaceae bacterium]